MKENNGNCTDKEVLWRKQLWKRENGRRKRNKNDDDEEEEEVQVMIIIIIIYYYYYLQIRNGVKRQEVKILRRKWRRI